MSNQEAKFLLSCSQVSQFPHHSLPEIAIIGRSNVGKSSLINAITNKKLLAKVSKTPGATRTINFFLFTDELMLVDLPGYGYAKVPHHVKGHWEKLILDYLEIRDQLSLCIVLIDGKVGFKNNDLDVINLLRDLDRRFQIIFTKTEKITLKEKEALFKFTLDKFPEFDPTNTFFTSSKNGNDIKKLMSFIINHARK